MNQFYISYETSIPGVESEMLFTSAVRDPSLRKEEAGLHRFLNLRGHLLNDIQTSRHENKDMHYAEQQVLLLAGLQVVRPDFQDDFPCSGGWVIHKISVK